VGAAVLLASAAACTSEKKTAPPPPGVCAAERRRADGGCCPPWWRGQPGGCIERGWRGDPALGEGASSPQVAVAASGWVLAWVSSPALGSATLMVAEENGGAPRLHDASAALSGPAQAPRVAVGPAGEAIVTWRQGSGDEGVVHRSVRLPGGSFVDPTGAASAVSFAPNAYEPTATIAHDGEVLQVWNQWKSPGYGIALARRAPGSGSFESPANARDVLSPDIYFSNYPQIARNDRGDAIVSWYQSTGAALRTYASERSGLDGSFSRPAADQALSPAAGPVAGPAPAIAPNGEAAVAWKQEPGAGLQAVYLALRDAQGNWSRPLEPFSLPVDDVAEVRAAFAPTGDLYVVWQERRGQDIAVVAAHRTPDGRWLARGVEPMSLSEPGVRAIDPELAVGPDGGVVVVWARLDAEGWKGWKIVARKSSAHENAADEAARWGAAEVLSAAGDNAAAPAVAVGGANDRAVVVWAQDGRVGMATLD
jgi:hypothetical protein